MSDATRSRVVRFAEARARIPTPTGDHAVTLLQRGTLDIALSMRTTPKLQTPHEQDEVYVVVRGHGVLVHQGERERLEIGDLAFVAAGVEHQLEDLSTDFAVWRIFHGRRGGEVAGDAGRRSRQP